MIYLNDASSVVCDGSEAAHAQDEHPGAEHPHGGNGCPEQPSDRDSVDVLDARGLSEVVGDQDSNGDDQNRQACAFETNG